MSVICECMYECDMCLCEREFECIRMYVCDERLRMRVSVYVSECVYECMNVIYEYEKLRMCKYVWQCMYECVRD